MEFCLDYQIMILEMDWNKDYITSEELIEHSNYDLDTSIGLYIGTKTSFLWGISPKGWPSSKDPARMSDDPSFEPWLVPGMGGGSTRALRLTASSLGVLGWGLWQPNTIAIAQSNIL